MKVLNFKEIVFHPIEGHAKYKIPYVLDEINAGFPSPANDYIKKKLDLNEHLIKRPSSTFIVRARGDSMEPLIYAGDELIVDKLENAKNKSIVIAIVNGEFTMKRLILRGEKKFLVPENSKYDEIEISESIEIWGVVDRIIRTL